MTCDTATGPPDRRPQIRPDPRRPSLRVTIGLGNTQLTQYDITIMCGDDPVRVPRAAANLAVYRSTATACPVLGLQYQLPIAPRVAAPPYDTETTHPSRAHQIDVPTSIPLTELRVRPCSSPLKAHARRGKHSAKTRYTVHSTSSQCYSRPTPPPRSPHDVAYVSHQRGTRLTSACGVPHSEHTR